MPIKKPAIKFIDKLNNFLIESGMDIHREGWEDYKFDKSGKRSEQADDKCEWVDIKLKEENGQRYIVQFYFTDNCTKLAKINVYVQKRKKGWKPEKTVASSKEKKELENPQQSSTNQYRYA